MLDFGLYPNPTDTLTLIPFENSFHERYNRFPLEEVADSGYGSEENYRFMEENGIVFQFEITKTYHRSQSQAERI